jgi:hypothetical protein
VKPCVNVSPCGDESCKVKNLEGEKVYIRAKYSGKVNIIFYDT